MLYITIYLFQKEIIWTYEYQLQKNSSIIGICKSSFTISFSFKANYSLAHIQTQQEVNLAGLKAEHISVISSLNASKTKGISSCKHFFCRVLLFYNKNYKYILYHSSFT
uniref:Uncharacterized protein n=1 Tax=Oryza brachyantha TaxID=4533 RepID=J3MWF4_ORYBR